MAKMAYGVSINARWVVPPNQLVRAFEEYGRRVTVAVKAVADFICNKMQDEARRNAPWTDRTGNARSGLFAVAEEASRDIVNLYLSHTVEYGKYLELAHSGKYAIIMPTIEKNLSVILQMLKDIFKD